MNENHEHEFPDELISAYLDGELSPAEKVRVEEQLMDSAEHRRLFEELKSLRRSLQALPAESLGEDFAARVLRRAERELLAETAPAESVPASEVIADNVVALPPSSPPVDRGAWRGLMWSIAATAAAVGLVVFGPLFNQGERNVSQRDAQPPEMRAAPQSAGEVASDKAEQAKSASGGQPASIAGPADGASPQDSLPTFDHEERPAPAPLRDAFAAGDEMRKEGSNFSSTPGSQAMAPQRYEMRGGNAGRGSGASSQDKDRAVDTENRQAAVEKSAADRLANSLARDDVAGEDARILAKANEATGGNNGRTFGAGIGGGGASPLAMRSLRGQLQSNAAAPAMGVVSLDVTHDALAGKFFDQLLRRHDIQVELAAGEPAELGLAVQSPPVDKLLAEADDALGGEGGAGAAALADAGADNATAELKQAGQKSREGDNASGEDVDLMYVVASQEQIDGLLRDLQSQSGDVLAIAYDGVGLPKQGQGEGEAPARHREFRELAELKEAEVAKLAATDAKNEAEELSLAKPQAGAPLEAQAEGSPAPVAESVDFDDALGDAQYEQLDGEAKSGFARRLSLPLPSVAKADQQRGRGNEVAPAPALPAEEVADLPSEPHATLVEEAAPAADNVVTEEAEVAEARASAPAATPPANRFADGRVAVKKLKGQGLVRVLFVLRAVAEPGESAATESSPADAATATQPADE